MRRPESEDLWLERREVDAIVGWINHIRTAGIGAQKRAGSYLIR